ncbi:MAG: hypothetical protein RIS29_2718 [Bacteroidota bacterium]|jgi:D-amino-acid dehydrogenase
MSKIVIVGGGVVGLFTAWYLQKSGAKVTVVERTDLHDGCSFGNAGLIVPSHVVPFASPGMLRKGVLDMFKSTSPVAANLCPDLDLFQWYARFAASATNKHVQKSIPVLKELSLFSKSLYAGLKEYNELEFPFWEKGLLMLYKAEKVGEELRHEADIARKAGLKVTDLTTTDVHKFEPDALPLVSGGVHYHSDDHLNPSSLMQSLVKALQKSGVKIMTNIEVLDINIEGQKAVSIVTSKGNVACDDLVIAAGMWSLPVMKKIKVNMPVQPGKGYSFKVKANAKIHFPALLSDANVAVTPLGDGLTQFGGGMEVGYGDMKIRQARVKQIIKAVGDFYPTQTDMQVDEKEIWQGHRPCSFDGLPFIGKVSKYSNIYVGTGHSMMGVTLAPATGLLLSELITGKKTTLDLAPFNPGR